MKAIITFKKESMYAKSGEPKREVKDLTEVHHNYQSYEPRTAFESDTEGTGFTVGNHDIEQFEVFDDERVICAAVRAEDGTVIRGHRHAHALWTLHMIPGYDTERPHGDDQGFVTSRNRYVNRREAYEIQKAAGIASVLEGTPYSGSAYAGGECFSEDLY